MANQNYSEFPERRSAAGGTAPDPIPRGSATPKVGRAGTYAQPKTGSARKVRAGVGPRVKTSMVENY